MAVVKVFTSQNQSRKRRKVRPMQRKFCDSVNEQYASTATITFLHGSQRKRLSVFELLPGGGHHRNHIPSHVNHTWDMDAIVKEMREWPQDQGVNWSEVARKHNLPGKNGGQIMKTIAEKCGVDVSQFSGGGKERTRVRKRRLPGLEFLSLPI